MLAERNGIANGSFFRKCAHGARRDLAVDPIPFDLASEQNEFVLQIDDLVQPALNRSFDHVVLCSSAASPPPMHYRSTVRESTNEITRFGVLKLPNPCNLKIRPHPKKQTPDQSLRGLFKDNYMENREWIQLWSGPALEAERKLSWFVIRSYYEFINRTQRAN